MIARTATLRTPRLLTAFAAMVVAAAIALLVATPAHAAWQTNKRYNSPDSVWADARKGGVWLIGDSITVNDYPPLVQAFLANGKPVAVDATAGVPTTPALDRLYERVHETGYPDTIVVALGSNDATTDPTVMDGQVRRLTLFVPRTTRIVWVNTWVFRNWTVGSDVAGTAVVNKAIDDRAAITSNFDVVDWHSFANRNPHYYLRDGVHTTHPEGMNARNGIIFRVVQS